MAEVSAPVEAWSCEPVAVQGSDKEGGLALVLGLGSATSIAPVFAPASAPEDAPGHKPEPPGHEPPEPEPEPEPGLELSEPWRLVPGLPVPGLVHASQPPVLAHAPVLEHAYAASMSAEPCCDDAPVRAVPPVVAETASRAVEACKVAPI